MRCFHSAYVAARYKASAAASHLSRNVKVQAHILALKSPPRAGARVYPQYIPENTTVFGGIHRDIRTDLALSVLLNGRARGLRQRRAPDRQTDGQIVLREIERRGSGGDYMSASYRDSWIWGLLLVTATSQQNDPLGVLDFRVARASSVSFGSRPRRPRGDASGGARPIREEKMYGNNE